MATERLVSAICNGTVIDHIPAGQALRLVALLKLASGGHRVTLGLNLKSRTLGSKDLIKVEDWELSAEEADQMAVFAPQATVSIIRDYEVTSKHVVTLPKAVLRVLACPNKNCITHVEKMATCFYPQGAALQEAKLAATSSKRHLRCHYCERVFTLQDIQEYRVGR